MALSPSINQNHNRCYDNNYYATMIGNSLREQCIHGGPFVSNPKPQIKIPKVAQKGQINHFSKIEKLRNTYKHKFQWRKKMILSRGAD